MKKPFAAMLAAVFLLTSLCTLSGCGSSTAGSIAAASAGSSAGSAAASATTAAAQTDAPDTPQETQPAAGDAGNTEAAGNAANTETAAAVSSAPTGTAEAGQDAPTAAAAEALTTEQIAEYAQTSYNDLASAIMLGMQDLWQSVTTESLGISGIYAANPESSFGFLIQDINSDGIPELLIGETVDNDASSPIYDIFTADNTGELIHVFSGDENNRCFLYENGTLANLSSSDGQDSSFVHYVLEDGMLVADDSGESGGNYVDIAFTYFIAS